MKYVYVAGPITLGDIETNICHGIALGDVLLRHGYFPYVPHLTYYWNKYFSHTWEEWLKLDEAWLIRCDALLRIPGPSKGADREVAFAQAHNIPVFDNLVDLTNWVEGKVQVEII